MTASKPTKDYVFVSYARSDSEVVGRVAGALEARGVDLWRDTEDISAATFWSEQIVDAIQHSSGVLLFLSPASAYSENVSKELSIALEEHKTILPVYLEPTDLSNRLRYQLTGIQYLELPDHADVGRLDQIAAVLQNLVAGNSTGPVKPPRRSSAGPGAGRRVPARLAYLLGAVALLSLLGFFAYRSGLLDRVLVEQYPDINLVMYVHDAGLTRQQAEKIRRDLHSYGMTVNVFDHRDRAAPDAVFIGDFVPVEIAREVLEEVPYEIEYLFPNDYSAVEGGDPRGLTIGIGYMSGHNRERRPPSSTPVHVSAGDLRFLTESGISDSEFQKRLRQLILQNPRYPQ
ncbi:MAG: toll/interleukin-1 receptor domain-containing protein [Chromatiaceae bacterium]|nr:toll/interleukin-1 receptor domain-containing protein [Chromatiaceae bacterium]